MELHLCGGRIRKSGDAAAGLIGSAGVLVLRDWQRRVSEVRRVAEVVGHLSHADRVAACIGTVGRDEPLDTAALILIFLVHMHLGWWHRSELKLRMRDEIGQGPRQGGRLVNRGDRSGAAPAGAKVVKGDEDCVPVEAGFLVVGETTDVCEDVSRQETMKRIAV